MGLFNSTPGHSKNTEFMDELIIRGFVNAFSDSKVYVDLKKSLEQIRNFSNHLDYSDNQSEMLLFPELSKNIEKKERPNFYTQFDSYNTCVRQLNQISWKDLKTLKFPDFKKADAGIKAKIFRKFLHFTEFLILSECPDKIVFAKIKHLSEESMIEAAMKFISIFELSWPEMTHRLIAASSEKRLHRALFRLKEDNMPEKKFKKKEKEKPHVLKGYEKFARLKEKYSLTPKITYKRPSKKILAKIAAILEQRAQIRPGYDQILKDEKKYIFHKLELAQKQMPLTLFFLNIIQGNTKKQYAFILDAFIKNPDDFWGYYTPLQEANFLVKIIFPNVNKLKKIITGIENCSDFIISDFTGSITTDKNNPESYFKKSDFYLQEEVKLKFAWQDFSLKKPDFYSEK